MFLCTVHSYKIERCWRMLLEGPARAQSTLERRPSAGGLVSALEPVLRKQGGTWVGWAGIDLQEGEEIRK